jgi:F0F1-type ATP synthase assembly protein I
MADENETGADGGNKWVYVAAVTQFTTSPIAGGAVGYFADIYFKTAPTLALIGFILGFLAGTINLVRLLKVPGKTS